jgi:SNF2 family DNA or RNA helicase
MIEVNVDPLSFDAKIRLPISDEILVRRVISIFSVNDTYIDLVNGSFALPWAIFQEQLYNFVSMCQQYGYQIQFDELAHKFISQFVELSKYQSNQKAFIQITDIELLEILESQNFCRKLTPEQVRDTKKLLQLRHGANFSVPGAGKTTTLLAVNALLRYFDRVTKLIVISPKNAFISWEEEVEEIYKGFLSVYRLQDLSYKTVKTALHNYDVILINYEKLRKDTKNLIPFFLKNKIHLVLDESHRIKSGDSNLSFTEINRLSDLCYRRDILSGTPMPQDYSDLTPQFSFLWRKNLLPEEKIDTSEQASKKVHETLSPLFVRTTKAELGLSTPIRHFIKVKMGPIQTEIYELLKSEAYRKTKGLSREQNQFLRTIGSMSVRLMQAATNPMLLSSEDEYFNDILDVSANSSLWSTIFQYSKYERPAKFNFLMNYVSDYLGKNENNKVVIWTYFIKNIIHLEKILTAFYPTTIYGAVSTGDEEDTSTREGRIKLFHNDPACRILIANPQACGEGISLHKASHHAIYLDRNFNAAYYLQSVDRIHRLGLSKSTITEISFLVSENTIDEVINNRLNQKTERMADVLNDKSLKKLALDPYDIKSTETLGLDNQDIDDVMAHLSGV